MNEELENLKQENKQLKERINYIIDLSTIFLYLVKLENKKNSVE